MARLFASFPDGRPGVGLLLLRGGVGTIVLARATMLFVSELDGGASALVVVKALTALLLIIGLLTPYAGLTLCLNALISLRLVVGGAWQADAALLVAVTSLALALVGPGAYSMDARLFGRREIIVPPR